MSIGNSSIPERVTQIIIERLEAGCAPWRQPWKNLVGEGANHNAYSRHEYTGVNRWTLAVKAIERGYDDPRWLTYKQAREHGGNVRHGERGQLVVFFKMSPTMVEGLDSTGNVVQEVKHVPLLRAYTVFNVGQCDGLKLPAVTHDKPLDPIEEAEAVLAGYEGAPPISFNGNRAAYSPGRDEVYLPRAGQFDTPEHWYSVAFHEFVHSTGHRDRLNRTSLTAITRFSDHQYTREELTAELGACMLSTRAGIEAVTVDESAAYISHWVKFLKHDPKAVIVAAGAAEKAYRHILGASAPTGGRETARELVTA